MFRRRLLPLILTGAVLGDSFFLGGPLTRSTKADDEKPQKIEIVSGMRKSEALGKINLARLQIARGNIPKTRQLLEEVIEGSGDKSIQYEAEVTLIKPDVDFILSSKKFKYNWYNRRKKRLEERKIDSISLLLPKLRDLEEKMFFFYEEEREKGEFTKLVDKILTAEINNKNYYLTTWIYSIFQQSPYEQKSLGEKIAKLKRNLDGLLETEIVSEQEKNVGPDKILFSYIFNPKIGGECYEVSDRTVENYSHLLNEYSYEFDQNLHEECWDYTADGRSIRFSKDLKNKWSASPQFSQQAGYPLLKLEFKAPYFGEIGKTEDKVVIFFKSSKENLSNEVGDEYRRQYYGRGRRVGTAFLWEKLQSRGYNIDYKQLEKVLIEVHEMDRIYTKDLPGEKIEYFLRPGVIITLKQFLQAGGMRDVYSLRQDTH